MSEEIEIQESTAKSPAVTQKLEEGGSPRPRPRQAETKVLAPEDNGTSFLILNGGSGSRAVSGSNKLNTLTREAIIDRWQNSFTLNELLVSLGAEIFPVMQEGCTDLSPRER